MDIHKVLFMEEKISDVVTLLVISGSMSNALFLVDYFAPFCFGGEWLGMDICKFLFTAFW